MVTAASWCAPTVTSTSVNCLYCDLVRTWSCGGVNQHWALPDGREIVSTVAVAMMGTTDRVDDQLSAKEN